MTEPHLEIGSGHPPHAAEVEPPAAVVHAGGSAEIALKACPFCGDSLYIRRGANPYGRCETRGCWMHERRVAVPLHDPVQVAAWNNRVWTAA